MAGEAAPQAAMDGGHQDAGVFQREMGLLCFNWDSAYEIEAAGASGLARARRRDGLGGWMKGSPDEVTALIEADYREQPVSREDAP